MCYYARKDFSCADWRWGNMMERCPRQHRIGETCGAKLAHPDHIEARPEPCKTCQEIEVKKRRLSKINENIARWTAERGRFAALLEKAENERSQLLEKLNELQSQRTSVLYGMGGQKTGGYPGIPPANRLLSADSDPAFTWSSTSQARGYPTSGQYGGYSNATATATRTAGQIRTERDAIGRQGVPYTPYSSNRR